ncbi:MAG: 23S rRNA (adenine(2503)-C(2))-methyltransferase RlmN [Zhaonellaceae bacterium]|jgi:23S rRNA (adenine2503-C2)-methyltransferase
MGKIDLQGMDIEEITNLLKQLQEPEYRARQLFQWIHQKAAISFAEMTNIPKSLQAKLASLRVFEPPKIAKIRQSQLDDTVKYLLTLSDGNTVETVRMSYLGKDIKDRHTVCISCQVGCAMGCVFCATGLSGWRRNLTTGEILAQVLMAQRELQKASSEEKITNVVFMGMGEPLLNYENVLKAIHLLNNPLGLNIGMRKITVSTCGLVPQIYKLAEEKLPIVLAISLHAPIDMLRNKLLPINKKYPIKMLMEACRHYIQSTGRRITFEYALIADVNDSIHHAEKLANILSGLNANVNLIPLNNVEGTGLRRSSKSKAQAFLNNLKRAGIEATFREEKGSDIEAACGQLRRRGVEEDVFS